MQLVNTLSQELDACFRKGLLGLEEEFLNEEFVFGGDGEVEVDEF